MTVETALPASWVSRAATVLDTKTRTPQDFSNIGTAQVHGQRAPPDKPLLAKVYIFSIA